ncbi:hypothetical protein EON65_11030, partial [archaeon]
MVLHIGKTWTKHFKQQHGTIEQYLARYPQIFKEGAEKHYSMQQFVQVVPMHDFDKLQAEAGEGRGAGVGVGVGTSARQEEEDAMLARAIAASLDISSQDTDGDGNYSTIGSGAGKDKATSNDDIITRKEHAETPADEEGDGEADQDYDTHLSCQAELLLAQTFGQYYEFNDQLIRPVPFLQMDLAFQGVDSSYLLVYRKGGMEGIMQKEGRGGSGVGVSGVKGAGNKVEAQVIEKGKGKGSKGKKGEGKGSATSTSTPTPTPIHTLIPTLTPPLPAYWQAYVTSQNDDLERERRAYGESLHTLSVCVYHIEYDAKGYVYVSPLFFLLPQGGVSLEMSGHCSLEELIGKYNEHILHTRNHTDTRADVHTPTHTHAQSQLQPLSMADIHIGTLDYFDTHTNNTHRFYL